jgi:hypothetical protein
VEPSSTARMSRPFRSIRLERGIGRERLLL